jgi:hypothetical protein
LIAYSVPIVISMEEKRMIRSLGWVSSTIVCERIDGGGSADETIFFVPQPPLSLNLLTVKELNVLLRRKIKTVYISARSMGLLVCTIMSSPVSSLVSDTPNYRYS